MSESPAINPSLDLVLWLVDSCRGALAKAVESRIRACRDFYELRRALGDIAFEKLQSELIGDTINAYLDLAVGEKADLLLSYVHILPPSFPIVCEIARHERDEISRALGAGKISRRSTKAEVIAVFENCLMENVG